MSMVAAVAVQEKKDGLDIKITILDKVRVAEEVEQVLFLVLYNFTVAAVLEVNATAQLL
jgi:hypothetical protein